MKCSLCFQVGILKRVLEEVEKVMQEFKGMLYKSMEDPHIDLTNVWSSYIILAMYACIHTFRLCTNKILR